MGLHADGLWAASQVGNCVSRQNGKGDIIQARELYGLLVLGEQIIHTAHEVATAKNAFQRLDAVLDSSPELRAEVAHVRYTNGDQGIEFVNGGQISYRARTAGAGRGLDKISLIVYDEAQHLKAEQMAASSPTTLAAGNAQMWFAGSAGFTFSEIWWEMRKRALSGRRGRYCWVEHTAERVELVDGEVLSEPIDMEDVANWALANPTLGTRITTAALEGQLILGSKFPAEHLGVWEPLPRKAGAVASPFDLAKWGSAMDPASRRAGHCVIGVGVGVDQSSAALSFVGKRDDGLFHLEVIDSAAGVGWLADRLARAIVPGRKVAAVAVDASGPVGALLPELRRICAAARVELIELSRGSYADGCEAFVTAVANDRVRHLGQAWLSTGVGGVGKRKLGDGWVFDLFGKGADPVPLVSVAVALRGFEQSAQVERRSAYEDDGHLMVV